MTDCDLVVVNESAIQVRLEEADPFLKAWVEYLVARVKDLSKRVVV
ncbi:MAG: hypothetical protein AAFX76_05215 [Planctomycetota bacterium]